MPIPSLRRENIVPSLRRENVVPSMGISSRISLSRRVIAGSGTSVGLLLALTRTSVNAVREPLADLFRPSMKITNA